MSFVPMWALAFVSKRGMTRTMKQHVRLFAPALALAVAAAACESSVTRPSVTFMAPLASTPATGATYKYTQQPIVLTITNAGVVSAATVTYTLEVSDSTTFATKAFSKEGITEGTGGTTSVTLTTLAGPKTYYWRSRATVDAIAGEYSAIRTFSVGAPVVIDKPTLSSPSEGNTEYSTPVLVANTVGRTGPVTTMQYTFQLSTSSSFGSIAQQAVVNETTGGTSWSPTITLSETTYYWRVRVTDAGSGESSVFSDTRSFVKRNGVDLATVNIVLGPAAYVNWPVTNTITEAEHADDRLCVDSTGENWPSTAFFGDPAVQVVGNQWNFIFVNNRWYGGAGHWYRPNQTCKGEMDSVYFIEGFLGREPFASFRPTHGMIWGVGLSTPARAWPAMATLDHRSNVVMITWD